MIAADAVAGVYREEWTRIVATLIRATGDWDVAEEADRRRVRARSEPLAGGGRAAESGRLAHDGGAEPRTRRAAARAASNSESSGNAWRWTR